MPQSHPCILACENFSDDFAATLGLEPSGGPHLRAFPARCGQPPVEWEEIARLAPPADFNRVHIFGAGCLALLGAPPRESYRIERMRQCFHLLAPEGLVDSCIAEGAYMVTRAWLGQWKNRVKRWGSDRNSVRALLSGALERIALIDTGVRPECTKDLEAFADFVGLPFTVHQIGPAHLRESLRKVIHPDA